MVYEEQKKYRVLKDSIKTQYTVIELFAGAGGLALGLENSGLSTKALVEIDKSAASTLRLNRPSWNIIEKDISKVSFCNENADIVTGGFPCQSFSFAGKKLGFEDLRGTLFFEFARVVKEVQPKVFLAENVKGLKTHDGGKTLSTMISVLENMGYKVEWKILYSQFLDVPQKRERLIIIGVRDDLQLPIIFPENTGYVITVREALENVPKSFGKSYSESKAEVLKHVPEGSNWKQLPEELKKSYMGKLYGIKGGSTGLARRLSWDLPSVTLLCSPAQKLTERCHPEETRPLTISEYARIQTFPDDWQFVGSAVEQYKQIGNAVPINLGYYLGKCIIKMLNFL